VIAEAAVPRCDHVVEFYDSDDDLVAKIGAYVVGGVEAGETAIVVATEAHRCGVEQYVSREKTGMVVFLDAEETLSSFLVDGVPDRAAFDRVVGGLVRSASVGGRPVRIFGEMVALLWDRGQVPAAIELETYWNELAQETPFSLFCAYPSAAFSSEICSMHTDVFGRPSACGHELPAEEAVRAFAATPDAPRAARRFVLETLHDWRDCRLMADAQLVVSELTTNAVIHAHSNFTVTIAALEDVVRISVTDNNPVLPTSRDPSLQATGGRGLRIVNVLAERWFAESRPHGKVVWADLLRHAR
jgi:anti-sigma regulatory factor (Ser/Thr protein kinase)